MKSKKWLRGIIIFLILIGLGVAFLAHNVLPYAILSRQSRVSTITPESLDIKAEKGVFQINDSLSIKGYYTYPQTVAPKAIIIMLHGIGGVKEHFYPLSKRLNEQSIATVVYDARSHGESDGEFITYGFYEKYDVQTIVDSIKNRHTLLPIGVWGNSMGGAVALQALAIEPRIDFGIIESTFTQLDKISYDYQKRYAYGIGLKPITNYALKRAGEIGQFDPNQVMPIVSVTQIYQPVFLAHGTADLNIKFEYGQQLYEKLASKDKIFYPFEDAGHFDLFDKGGDAYSDAIYQFISKQFGD